MKIAFIIFLLGIACGPGTSEESSTPEGKAHEDEDTGSVVYVPEDRDDVGVEGGSDVAVETTGAYLSIPGDVEMAGPSVNVTAREPVTDNNIAKWTVEVPMTTAPDSGSYAALFYHVEKEDGKIYYGVLTGDSITLTGNKLRAKMVGLGNYQPGLIEADVESTEVLTTDVILKQSEAALFVNRVLTLNGKIFAGMERGYLRVSDDDGASFSSLAGKVPSIIVRDMAIDDNDRLILATGLGVAVSDDGGSSFALISEESGLPDQAVNAIHISDNRIYAATAKGAAVIEKDKVTKVYAEKQGLQSVHINDLFFDASHNRLYAATKKGVAIISTEQHKVIQTLTDASAKLIDNDAKSVAVDDDQWLFVATENGLSHKSPNGSEFSALQTRFGFETDDITDICLHSKRVYVATSRKLSIFDITSAGNFSAPNNIGIEQGMDDVRVLSVTVQGETIFTTHRTGAHISKDGGTSFTALELN